MRIGYVRVSTIEQNEQRQIEALEKERVEKIFIDKKSGKNLDRESFKEMMNFVREGDTIVTESISRIARNTKDLLTTVEDLEKKKVGFVSLKENINTSTPQGRFVLTIFGAIGELERGSLRQRQAEGIEIAKRAGKYRGRKPIKIDEERFREVCSHWRSGEITAKRAMELLNLKPNTFYKHVKILNV